MTRARPKTDRIACPWLIRRFIDTHAEILYVPKDVARDHPAHSFDAPGDRRHHRRSDRRFHRPDRFRARFGGRAEFRCGRRLAFLRP